jgi:hypothetical protein
MIALLPSLIVALIVMIHERRHHHPIQMWVKEDWVMFTMAVVFWPIAVMAILWVIVWPKVSCWFGNHRFITAQEFSVESRRVHCLHCKQSFAMTDRTHTLTPWDRSWHELYEQYGHTVKYLSSEVRWK